MKNTTLLHDPESLENPTQALKLYAYITALQQKVDNQAKRKAIKALCLNK
jgi:hypothetical protein